MRRNLEDAVSNLFVLPVYMMVMVSGGVKMKNSAPLLELNGSPRQTSFLSSFPRRFLWSTVVAILFIGLLTLRHGPQLQRNSPGWRSSSQSVMLDDINNSTLGFEKVFVVGLPSRSDRRDGMTLAASLSQIDIEFIDGVIGDTVAEKAVPVGEDRQHLKGASLGSWRGHMNAIQEIVRRNLSTALIFEDDIDWDIRLRDQLKDFAMSTRALIQPLKASPGSYADVTFPQPREGSPTSLPDLSFYDLPSTRAPMKSAYGDGWDMLWIGHCGMHFPFESNNLMPKGRVIHKNDETVAPKKNLWTFNSPFTLKEKYPEHTRAVHHAQEGVCCLGYAVSQQGARKLLHELALKPPTDGYDILLRFFCEGSRGRSKSMCLTTQPSLFHHYKPPGPVGHSSDIGDHGDAFNKNEWSDMVRWSVRLNADKLMRGDTNYTNQYPDDA